MYREIGAAPRYLPSDVIAGMLLFVKNNYFTGNAKLIHEVIYDLRKKFEILKVFPFSMNDVYPFSRSLEKVLFSLQRSRLIGMENPDFERFVIKENGRNYIENKIIPRFTEEEKKILMEIGKIFEEKCGEG